MHGHDCDDRLMKSGVWLRECDRACRAMPKVYQGRGCRRHSAAGAVCVLIRGSDMPDIDIEPAEDQKTAPMRAARSPGGMISQAMTNIIKNAYRSDRPSRRRSWGRG